MPKLELTGQIVVDGEVCLSPISGDKLNLVYDELGGIFTAVKDGLVFRLNPVAYSLELETIDGDPVECVCDGEICYEDDGDEDEDDYDDEDLDLDENGECNCPLCRYCREVEAAGQVGGDGGQIPLAERAGGALEDVID